MIKIIELIDALDSKEKRQIRLELQQNEKERLYNLFIFLVKKGSNRRFAKAEVFEKVFGKAFTERGDVLLRNEIRLLSNWIKEYLRLTLITEKAKKDKLEGIELLLQYYLDNNKLSLFEKEWRKYKRQCLEQHNYTLMAKIYGIYTRYLEEKKEVKLWVYQEIAALSHDQIQQLSTAFKEQVRYTEIQKIKANKVIQAFLRTYPMPELQERLELKAEKQEAVVHYHYLRARSYLESGQKKIQTLKEAEKIYYEIRDYRPQQYADLGLIYGSIGLEYFLQGDYQAAYAAYVKTLDFLKATNQAFNANLYYNYVSILLKLDRYQELIDTVLAHQEGIQKSKRLKYRFEYMLVMSYLFKGEVDNAFQLVHREINKRPESEYYNFRYVYGICFYLMGDVDSFEREIINIKQKVDYQPPIEKEFAFLADIFHLFIKWRFYTPERNEQEKLLNRLEKKIKEAGAQVRLFKDILIAKWLIREMNSLQKKTTF